MHAPVYPATRRVDVVDTMFGHRVADPYRWLEADARHDGEVAAWIAAQNAATQACLANLPGREVLRARLKALQDHEKFTVPRERGGRYFYTRNPGLENQAALLVRDGVDGADRVLIDPNAWSEHGTLALAEWAPSDDGALLAYAVQQDGADWRTIRVIDVASGDALGDELAWARFTTIAWVPDGSGFFYTRYPEPAAGDAALAGHGVYFHLLGTPQESDRLLHATPQRPELLHFIEVTRNGRYALITSTPGIQANSLVIVDLADEGWPARTVVDHFDAEWSPLDAAGDTLYLLTSDGAERRRIATLDLADPAAAPRDLVPEDSAAVLGDARLVGGRLVGTYLVDVKTELRRFTLDGRPDGVVPLPGIGSAGGFQGQPDANEAFFVFTSFNAPTTILRYDVAANTAAVWAAPTVDADLARIAVEQRFYASKDGTRVPMFLIRRSDVDGPAPTLLHGYGAFGISMVSFYDPSLLAWIEQGGVVAIANIRGGGEYGKAWHAAARGDNKQTTFDDFIAAAEYLHAERIVTPDGLAVHGESGGGLLVGAVVNQHPDLFAAALPGVGVMDMLRFDRFTGGRLWMGEFGDPANEEHFGHLRAYSPYHNVASRRYPAILVTTADTDDRVVPAHSFKYVAALQNVDAGPRPRLLRIDVQAGHGAGKPMAKAIDEMADKWAFAAHWTGLKVEARQ